MRSRRLRVAILGLDAPRASWAAPLAGRDVAVEPADTADALLVPGVGLGVAFTDARSAEQIAREAAARPDPPALALMVGEPESHPHGRLLAALLAGKNDWERTFDAIVDAVCIIDGRGQVVRANLQLAGALGRKVTEVVGRPYLELFGPLVPPSAVGGMQMRESEDPIAQSLSDHQPRLTEARYARLPGRLEVSVSPAGEAGEGGRRLVVILKDVSERREQQERFLLASRLADVGQLAAGVAHEINTPLASIALRAESLLKAAADPQLQAVPSFKNFPRYLKTIDEEIFRCKKIIGALLDFSRARRQESRETDVNALAEQAVELVGHQARLKQVTLSVQPDPALPPLHADDGPLRQALLALLMNALAATPPGGRVEVRTARGEDGTVAVTVCDSGSGIAPEHVDKIFSPFFTTKPVGQGTGLGLAICHGIVTSHGGHIDVASEPGRGTRISLVFPRPRAAGEA
ncbi:MAG TPA: ATP-binding protein [Vicinamibacteria bacterium]|nr:ATP-binding protein [Vicinamibacteria bacterium]